MRYINVLLTYLQCNSRRDGIIWEDLGTLTTAQAREVSMS